MPDDSVLCQIRKALDRVANELVAAGQHADSMWTPRVLGAISDIGHGNQWEVCCSHSRAEYGEWLHDRCWLRYRQWPDHGDYTLLESVGLALECEWSKQPSEIAKDLQKLLPCKAAHKVMVFQDNERSPPSGVDLIQYMTDNIERFWDGATDERGKYLLARYINQESRFEYHDR